MQIRMAAASWFRSSGSHSVDARIELEGAPVHVATDEYAVWVRNERDGSVVRIDPEPHAVTRIETALFGSKGNIVAGGGYIWVLAESRMGRAMVAQIDPQTDLTVRTYKLGRTGRYISFGSGSLWVSGPTLRKITPNR